MCCWALGTVPGLQFVGLCHGVQTTMDLIASYIGVQEGRDRLRRRRHQPHGLVPPPGAPGRGPLPAAQGQLREAGLLREREGARRGHAPLRLLHDREHGPPLRVPALLPQEPEGAGRSTATSRPSAARPAPTTSTARCSPRSSQKIDPLSIESTKLGPRSAEYCSHIIEAKETGRVFRLNGNVRNDGYITNLPQRLLRRGADLRGPDGPAPDRASATCRRSCAALNMTNVLVQGLTVEAALHGRPGAGRCRPWRSTR